MGMGDEPDTTPLEAPEHERPAPPASRASSPRSARRRRVMRFASRALVVLALLWVVGALTRPFEPPFVQWREHELPERPDPHVLPELELVELDSGGRTLRGWYVPADPGAPLVLHLMGSGLSVFDIGFGFQLGSGSVGVARMSWGARQLTEGGFASLAVDYGGVGRSEGSRSLAQFRNDARSMWNEALRRVDGDPSRLLVRGVSLGSLGAGLLLAEGARPRAVLLHTPVLAETVVGHFARGIVPEPVAALALPLLGDGLAVDLCAAITDAGVPTALFLERDDELLPLEESLALSRAVSSTGGTSFADSAARHWTFGALPDKPLVNHIHAAMRAAHITEAEAAVLSELGPGIDVRWRTARVLERALPELRAEFDAHADEAAHARLEDLAPLALLAHPDLLVAAALVGMDADAVAELDAAWPSALPPFLRDQPAAAMLRLLDLRDPSGDLPADLLVLLGRVLWDSGEAVTQRLTPLDFEDARALWAGMQWVDPRWNSPKLRWYLADGSVRRTSMSLERGSVWERLADQACREDAAGALDTRRRLAVARRAQRLVLKACGVPERLKSPASRISGLEALHEGRWVTVVLSEALVRSASDPVVLRFGFEPSPPDPALSEPWWVANRRR